MWRAYFGRWAGSGEHPATLNAKYDEWADARDALSAEVREYLSDDCEHCRRQSTAAYASLQTTAPGSEVSEDVDGFDVMLTRAN